MVEGEGEANQMEVGDEGTKDTHARNVPIPLVWLSRRFAFRQSRACVDERPQLVSHFLVVRLPNYDKPLPSTFKAQQSSSGTIP